MIQKLLFALLTIGFLAGAASFIQTKAQNSNKNKDGKVIRASAVVSGTSDSKISGEATFEQKDNGILPTVLVRLSVKGLEPNSIHGVHIHEIGKCEANFTSAGGHFDPGAFGHSALDNHPYHMGDIPNLVADKKGVATLEYRTSRISLSKGLLSLFDENGSAIVVHAGEDLGTPNNAGGARIGCGVIKPETE
jgi:Cu-Zn family superoxide dismutase